MQRRVQLCVPQPLPLLHSWGRVPARMSVHPFIWCAHGGLAAAASPGQHGRSGGERCGGQWIIGQPRVFPSLPAVASVCHRGFLLLLIIFRPVSSTPTLGRVLFGSC